MKKHQTNEEEDFGLFDPGDGDGSESGEGEWAPPAKGKKSNYISFGKIAETMTTYLGNNPQSDFQAIKDELPLFQDYMADAGYKMYLDEDSGRLGIDPKRITRKTPTMKFKTVLTNFKKLKKAQQQ